MDRRALIGLVMCGSIVVFAGRGRTTTTVRRIGILSPDALPSQAELKEEAAPLRALGWVEGENLLVERRYANGRVELLRSFAEELVQLKVEIIVTLGTAATLAAKNATNTIPIVIWSAGDPVRTGIVASLSRPGGNITGFSMLGPEIDAKRLALLRELLPGLQRVGVLENSTSPHYRAVRNEFEQTCRSLGVKPIFVEVAAASEMENAITEMAHQRAQAVLVPSDRVFYDGRVPLLTAAAKYALLTMTTDKKMLEEGALVFFTNSNAEQDQRYAAFVDRILRGAKPADLPIEQPTKFELGINLKTASSLGITVPQSLLLRADEVIR